MGLTQFVFDKQQFVLNSETGFPAGPVIPDPYSQLLVFIHHGLKGDAEKHSRKYQLQDMGCIQKADP